MKNLKYDDEYVVEYRYSTQWILNKGVCRQFNTNNFGYFLKKITLQKL